MVLQLGVSRDSPETILKRNLYSFYDPYGFLTVGPTVVCPEFAVEAKEISQTMVQTSLYNYGRGHLKYPKPTGLMGADGALGGPYKALAKGLGGLYKAPKEP